LIQCFFALTPQQPACFTRNLIALDLSTIHFRNYPIPILVTILSFTDTAGNRMQMVIIMQGLGAGDVQKRRH